MELKLMTVANDQDKRRPKILITGSQLDRFGFIHETIVTVFGDDGCLTMKAQGTGLAVYKQLVGEVRTRKGYLFQILNLTRKKTETHLILEGDWLERQGFFPGDPILVYFEPGLLRVWHVPLAAMGFSTHSTATYRVTTVLVNRSIPIIRFHANWLSDCGFTASQSASLSYEDDGFLLKPCQKTITGRRNRQMPTHVPLSSVKDFPFLRISGRWMYGLGFQPGDLLITQCLNQQIRIKRLVLG